MYRKWSRGRLVDGVILVDLRADDPRIAAVRALGLPAVVAGPPEVADGLTCVWTNDGAAAQEAVRYLGALGHRDIARVSGPSSMVHVGIRQRAIEQTAQELGMSVRTWYTDYSVDLGRRATREILLSTPRPTAIMYDDDLGAVTGLAVARELNFRVPEDVSLLAWDDSNLCQTTFPPLSAMSHDVLGYGAHLTRRLLELLAGAQPGRAPGRHAQDHSAGEHSPAVPLIACAPLSGKCRVGTLAIGVSPSQLDSFGRGGTVSGRPTSYQRAWTEARRRRS